MLRVKRLKVHHRHTIIMEEKNYQSFEDLFIWKEAMRFSLEVYQLFRDSKDFGFRDQMQVLRFLSLQILLRDLSDKRIRNSFSFYL